MLDATFERHARFGMSDGTFDGKADGMFDEMLCRRITSQTDTGWRTLLSNEGSDHRRMVL